MTQHGSPYTPPGRSKGGGSRYGRSRGVVSTMSSNVVLTTLGSIHPDPMDIDVETDVVEMDDIPYGMNLQHLGDLNAAVGGDDGEPLPEGEDLRDEHFRGSPAPAYNSLEMGFRGGNRSSRRSVDQHSDQSIVRGIRVDIEHATSEC